MTTKHTPGPWRVVTDGINYWVEVNNRIIIVSKGRSKVEAKQHANLIAAAPEMLEALEDILQRLEDDLFLAGIPREQHKEQRHLKRLYKAIAKARGEV